MTATETCTWRSLGAEAWCMMRGCVSIWRWDRLKGPRHTCQESCRDGGPRLCMQFFFFSTTSFDKRLREVTIFALFRHSHMEQHLQFAPAIEHELKQQGRFFPITSLNNASLVLLIRVLRGSRGACLVPFSGSLVQLNYCSGGACFSSCRAL